ncbi:MAG: sigma-70 family RNA polymerase sigma factor [Bryobacteraceae bacterium]
MQRNRPGLASSATWRLAEQEALSRLYDETSSVVYGLALRILRNPADAEEAVLDAYTRAWKQAPNFDPGRAGVMTWLVMMTRSISIDRLRSQANRASKTETLDEPQRQEASPDPGPEFSAVFGQQRERIQAAMAQLSAEQRQVIELAFFEGLSHSELADRLGIPLGTVKTRVRLGLGKLRSLLEELA